MRVRSALRLDWALDGEVDPAGRFVALEPLHDLGDLSAEVNLAEIKLSPRDALMSAACHR